VISRARRRSLLATFLALLALAISTHAQGTQAQGDGARRGSRRQGSPQPNVVVILGDDFNWTDLGTVATPNLNALARSGMTFRRAYSFPVCSTIFGRYPRRDGIGELVSFAPVDADNPTPALELTSIAECLRGPRAWYQTGMFGKWHLGANVYYDNREPDIGPYNLGALTPNLQGFSQWFGAVANLRDYFQWERCENGVFTPSTEYATGAIEQAFERWWSSRTGPRFAYFAFHNAHAEYHAPPPEFLPPGYPTPSGRREEFEAMIASLDLLIGRMLALVDLRETYVIFLTDNGTPRGVSLEDCPPRPDELFNPFDCAKHTVFEPGVRMPMFVAGPGVVPGSETQAVVSCVDIMATVCELAGVPVHGEDSVSFARTLREPSFSARRYAFTEIFGEFDQFNGIPGYKQESAAIGARYKLRRINGAEMLYDLHADPREADPLPLRDPAFAEVLADLRAVLDDPLERALQAP
jgi:arylsulfatase B